MAATKPAIPASIPMPDSPLRKHWAYQLAVRLPRSALDWVGTAGAGWALFVGDVAGRPMENETRLIVLVFVGSLYGIRTFEKRSGVA